MHDPMTVAFDIRSPFYRWRTLPNGQRYKERSTLITIWHNDPETDGSDDSCGWSTPRLTERERKIIDEIIKWEANFPYFSSPFLPAVMVDPKYTYHQQLIGDCLGHVAAAWQLIAWHRDRRRQLTAGEWWHVVNLATNPTDNLRATLSDPDRKRSDQARHFLTCVMRAYLDHHRLWYRHPRWHIHHWKIQCQPLQRLKRWLFSRCANCGGRFRYGEAPTSSIWDNDGPRWFQSEPYLYHHDCYPVKVKQDA